MRVVLDTNVVVSAYLHPQHTIAQILEKWKENEFDLLISAPILAEYQNILQRPRIRIRHQLNDEQIAEVIESFKELAIWIEPAETLSVVENDPDDNKFIECAVAGAAEYIVSGDPHLLTIHAYRGIYIVSPAQFLSVMAMEKGVE
jgi:putative PIN family toxin of toxin-antitoxin system